MPSALREFVAEPSLENYLAAREELLIASTRTLSPAELDSLTLLAEAGDMRGLTAALGRLPPIAALVPRVHYYAALAAEARQDSEDLELEQMLLVICLRAMLLSGDGSQDAPYVVCAPSDELDLLQELDLVLTSRKLVPQHGSVYDQVQCDDGSEVWFDASAMVQIPAEMPAEVPVGKEKRAKSAGAKKPRRRLSRTAR